MLNLEPITIGRFAGIDNVSDQSNIVISARLAYLKTAINVDIDSNRMLHRRPGRSKVYSGTPRCFWPQTDVGVEFSLFLEGGSLKQFNPDYSTPITLLTGLDIKADMDFVYVNGRVYYTNGTVIGYIKDGVATAFPSPASSKQFKRILKAGTYIEYYRSRLYTAIGNVLSFSDAVRTYRMDNRHPAKQFDGNITMMRSVNDGMYVSAGKFTYFLHGVSPEKMSPVKVTDSPAFPGSGVKVGAQKIAPGGAGQAVYWESKEGVFLGLAGGVTKNLTWNKFRPKIIPNRTSSMYRDDGGYGQYICTYELPQIPALSIASRFPVWTGVTTIS